MGDTVTLAVVNEGGGEKGSGSESCSWGGRRGSCRAWERREVVEVGRGEGAEEVE